MRITQPKYRQIYEALAQDIRQGKTKPGQKLPSEAALVKRFDASRITVTRALRDLQQAGLVERVAGSGTYVRSTKSNRSKGLTFGLIIPDLGETEIFEPVCQGIAAADPESEHALLWGQANPGRMTKEEQALTLCRQYISRDVAGVFFAPIEGGDSAEQANTAVLKLLRRAGIPVVLLDRRPDSPSEPFRADLAGIDNQRAGFLATNHLVARGLRHIAFIAKRQSAATVALRAAGYRQALNAAGMKFKSGDIFRFDQAQEMCRSLIESNVEGCVCVNDRIAGELMHALLKHGISIPADFRMVGIDDVNYATLLPVPLTTVRQPCSEIGRAALKLMLERIERPAMPARDVLLDCTLIVRQSCGSVKTMG